MKKFDLRSINKELCNFANVINKNKVESKDYQDFNNKELKVGVDLGTSSIVLTILDNNNKIIYGDFAYDNAVRDGIVVNFLDSVNILKELKEKAEKVLHTELLTAAGAIPPQTGEKSKKIVSNVIEEAGFKCTNVIDEPTAAAKFLGIENGTVVDIGGGTTGITIFKDKKIIKVLDKPTGGFHMTLVLGGRYHISNKEAEKLKRDHSKEKEVFPIIKPVVEKMGVILNSMRPLITSPIIVVGGATNFEQFDATFAKIVGQPIYKPKYPEFVTPLGIALFDTRI